MPAQILQALRSSPPLLAPLERYRLMCVHCVAILEVAPGLSRLHQLLDCVRVDAAFWPAGLRSQQSVGPSRPPARHVPE